MNGLHSAQGASPRVDVPKPTFNIAGLKSFQRATTFFLSRAWNALTGKANQVSEAQLGIATKAGGEFIQASPRFQALLSARIDGKPATTGAAKVFDFKGADTKLSNLVARAAARDSAGTFSAAAEFAKQNHVDVAAILINGASADKKPAPSAEKVIGDLAALLKDKGKLSADNALKLARTAYAGMMSQINDVYDKLEKASFAKADEPAIPAPTTSAPPDPEALANKAFVESLSQRIGHLQQKIGATPDTLQTRAELKALRQELTSRENLPQQDRTTIESLLATATRKLDERIETDFTASTDKLRKDIEGPDCDPAALKQTLSGQQALLARHGDLPDHITSRLTSSLAELTTALTAREQASATARSTLTADIDGAGKAALAEHSDPNKIAAQRDQLATTQTSISANAQLTRPDREALNASVKSTHATVCQHLSTVALVARTQQVKELEAQASAKRDCGPEALKKSLNELLESADTRGFLNTSDLAKLTAQGKAVHEFLDILIERPTYLRELRATWRDTVTRPDPDQPLKKIDDFPLGTLLDGLDDNVAYAVHRRALGQLKPAFSEEFFRSLTKPVKFERLTGPQSSVTDTRPAPISSARDLKILGELASGDPTMVQFCFSQEHQDPIALQLMRKAHLGKDLLSAKDEAALVDRYNLRIAARVLDKTVHGIAMLSKKQDGVVTHGLFSATRADAVTLKVVREAMRDYVPHIDLLIAKWAFMQLKADDKLDPASAKELLDKIGLKWSAGQVKTLIDQGFTNSEQVAQTTQQLRHFANEIRVNNAVVPVTAKLSELRGMRVRNLLTNFSANQLGKEKFTGDGAIDPNSDAVVSATKSKLDGYWKFDEKRERAELATRTQGTALKAVVVENDLDKLNRLVGERPGMKIKFDNGVPQGFKSGKQVLEVLGHADLVAVTQKSLETCSRIEQYHNAATAPTTSSEKAADYARLRDQGFVGIRDELRNNPGFLKHLDGSKSSAKLIVDMGNLLSSTTAPPAGWADSEAGKKLLALAGNYYSARLKTETAAQEKARAQLAGYDVAQLNTPTSLKLVGKKTPSIQELQSVREMVELLVRIRSGNQNISQQHVDIRAETAALPTWKAEVEGSLSTQVRAMVRAATAKAYMDSGLGLLEFRPAEHKAAILKQLDKWGLTKERLVSDKSWARPVAAAEVAAVLGSQEPIGDQLDTWLEDVPMDKDIVARIKETEELYRTEKPNGEQRLEATTKAIHTAVTSLTEGDRVVFSFGTSGNLVVQPPDATAAFTGGITVGAEFGFALENSIQVERRDKQYLVTIKGGKAGSAGLNIGAALGAVNVNVTGEGSRASGMRFTFANEADCRDLVQGLATGNENVLDSKATKVEMLSEKGIGASVNVTVGPPNPFTAFSVDSATKLISANASGQIAIEATASAGVKGKTSEYRSGASTINVLEHTVEVNLEATARMGVSTQTSASPTDDDPSRTSEKNVFLTTRVQTETQFKTVLKSGRISVTVDPKSLPLPLLLRMMLPASLRETASATVAAITDLVSDAREDNRLEVTFRMTDKALERYNALIVDRNVDDAAKMLKNLDPEHYVPDSAVLIDVDAVEGEAGTGRIDNEKAAEKLRASGALSVRDTASIDDHRILRRVDLAAVGVAIGEAIGA